MATAPEGGAPVADYQGNQAFSAINRYLHAARYHELRRFRPVSAFRRSGETI